MYVKTLNISGLGPFRELNLHFGRHMNLLCGPNGVGKTTVLDTIATCFANLGTSRVRRNAACEVGSCTIEVETNAGIYKATLKQHHLEPSQRSGFEGVALPALQSDLVVFKAQRLFWYINVPAIGKDPNNRNDPNLTVNGIPFTEVKQWFLQRFAWSAHDNILTPQQLSNLRTAQRCFSLLDPGVRFSRAKPDTLDILVDTPSGEIWFEYLSSGYQSSLAILLGIIMEIEYRRKEPGIEVGGFDGVLLIDEIDIHLHPQWQARFLIALRDLVPNAQVIATTHSPHMIQAARPDEVVPLVVTANRDIAVGHVPSERYGFQGWTVEEILSDVMGLDDTRSSEYRQTIESFQRAVRDHDAASAADTLRQLDAMLHPSNVIRKILRLQLADLGVSYE